MLQVAWGAWKCDSIMSDEDGRPVSRAHVFNGGSQQPRLRTNQPRQEDYTRLHARFQRMCGRRQARVAEQRKRWAVVCQEIRARAQWAVVCQEICVRGQWLIVSQEICARAQWSAVCQEIRARAQWSMVCQEVRVRGQWLIVSQEICARAQWSAVCQEIRARGQVQPRQRTQKTWRSVLATLWRSTAKLIGCAGREAS